MVGDGSHTTIPHDGGATEMVKVDIVSMEHRYWISSVFSVLTFYPQPHPEELEFAIYTHNYTASSVPLTLKFRSMLQWKHW